MERWEPRPIERRMTREAMTPPKSNGHRRRRLKSITVDVPRRRDDLRERALQELERRGVRNFVGDPVATLGDRWREDNS